jgi:hypothetical protein
LRERAVMSSSFCSASAERNVHLPEVIATMDFVSTTRTCCFRPNAGVNCDGSRKCFLPLASRAWPVFKIVIEREWRWRHENFNVLLFFYYILLYFISHSYFDNILSPLIFLKGFRDLLHWLKMRLLRESWSQRALALCIREARTDCLLAG